MMNSGTFEIRHNAITDLAIYPGYKLESYIKRYTRLNKIYTLIFPGNDKINELNFIDVYNLLSLNTIVFREGLTYLNIDKIRLHHEIRLCLPNSLKSLIIRDSGYYEYSSSNIIIGGCPEDEIVFSLKICNNMIGCLKYLMEIDSSRFKYDYQSGYLHEILWYYIAIGKDFIHNEDVNIYPHSGLFKFTKSGFIRCFDKIIDLIDNIEIRSRLLYLKSKYDDSSLNNVSSIINRDFNI